MIEQFKAWLAERNAARERSALIRNAQRKVANSLRIERDADGHIIGAKIDCAKVTGEEWNALAYEPMQQIRQKTDQIYRETVAKIEREFPSR